MSSQKQESLPHYIGHRQRLKQKVLNNDNAYSSLEDYELLEILLFFAIPRKDVKPLAKQLLNKFYNLSKLINISKNQLSEIDEVNDNTYIIFAVIRELIVRIQKSNVINKHVISSWSALLDYLKFSMSNLKTEQFRVLFLTKKNLLIADELMIDGTIDQAPVYPREIIKRGLFHEAGAVILVHNHPSGDCKPSRSDIDLTSKIVKICESVNITVHDHVIIGANDYFSFKSNLLL